MLNVRIIAKFGYLSQNICMGLSLNYVSIFEGGGDKMLTDAYVGEGGLCEMLT